MTEERFETPEDLFWLTVHKGEAGYSRGDFRCPACHQVNPCYKPTNYCSNCGVRLKGVKPCREKETLSRLRD